jgi:hypothetical protein
MLKLNCQVGMADAARLDANQHFARARLCNIAVHDLKWAVLRPGNGGSDPHQILTRSRRSSRSDTLPIVVYSGSERLSVPDMLPPYLRADFDPHMHRLEGSKPNCRGRCVSSSSISSTPTEYSNTIPLGPWK